MEIIVCIKQVPETRNVEVDEKTGVLRRDGVDSIMNPFDLYALETALRLKEAHGGQVSVISMGPPQAESVIREAFMMGADQGFLLSDRAFAGADTLATAYTLAEGIKKIGNFDLIVCGLQTTDGDTAQVGPGIGELLAIPHESNVMKVNSASHDSVEVLSDLGTTIQTKRIEFPCLITVTKTVGEPRLLSYRRKLAVKSKPITIWSAEDLTDGKEGLFGLQGSPTQVERIFPPEISREREMWEGSSVELSKKLVEKLQELRLVGGEIHAQN